MAGFVFHVLEVQSYASIQLTFKKVLEGFIEVTFSAGHWSVVGLSVGRWSVHIYIMLQVERKLLSHF